MLLVNWEPRIYQLASDHNLRQGNKKQIRQMSLYSYGVDAAAANCARIGQTECPMTNYNQN